MREKLRWLGQLLWIKDERLPRGVGAIDKNGALLVDWASAKQRLDHRWPIGGSWVEHNSIQWIISGLSGL